MSGNRHIAQDGAGRDDQLIFLTGRGIYLAGSDSVTHISEPIKPVLKDMTLRYCTVDVRFQYWLSDKLDVYIYDLTKGLGHTGKMTI